MTQVPIATAECVRHSAAAFDLTRHLGAVWRPGSGATEEAEPATCDGGGATVLNCLGGI